MVSPRKRMPSGTATLEKGLRLLAALVKDGGKTQFAELAATLGLPSSTAHRVLGLLQKEGLAVRIGPGRYSGGAELAALAQTASMNAVLVGVSRPVLRKLAKASRRTVHLGVFAGDMVTYLVKESGGETSVLTREGMQLEAYCSGIGKVLLSHFDDARLDKYLSAGPFVSLTSKTIVDPAKLRKEFARIRKKGFAIDDREVADDLCCLAMPLRNPQGQVVAGVSMAGAREVSQLQRHREALRDCVALIRGRIWPQAL